MVIKNHELHRFRGYINNKRKTQGIIERKNMKKDWKQQYKIAVAGTGYVGLSLAVLLAQHHHVTAVDLLQEKVVLINQRKSDIQSSLGFPKVF